MLSRSEIDYLHWLASTRYTGSGRIVEMGCFFGGSTMPLARGLEANVAAVTKPNILTYDSFIMDSDTAPRFPVNLGSGDSFRPVFEAYVRDHLARITIRQGWLPTSLGRGGERELYPEQEPVEILFVDVAKLWPVHDTILRTFGARLIPGRSILVQQDFKHHGCYWLGLHMLQLRDCFEPLHDVTGGASVAFGYKGGIEVELQALLAREDIAGASIAQAWRDVDAYWASQGATSIRLVQRLAAATHLADAGRPEEAGEFLALFEGEFRSAVPLAERGAWRLAAETDGFSRDESGESVVSDMELLRTEYFSALGRIAGASARAGVAERVPGGEVNDRAKAAWREGRRRSVIERVIAAGNSTVALYGAGRHTAEVLASGWPYGRLRVAAIVDDYSVAREIQGVAVVRPGSIPVDVQAVVISSEASEEALWAAATSVIRTIPVLRMYS